MHPHSRTFIAALQGVRTCLFMGVVQSARSITQPPPPPLRAIRRLLVWVTFRTNMLRHAYHNMPVFTYMYCAILFRCRGHA